MAEIETIKETIVKAIEHTAKSGKKLKPSDVEKKVAAELGCDRKEVKAGVKELVDAGTLTYAYLGGSYLVFPPKEGEIK
jgi:DNA-binding GntR family transcriptional regulator